MFEPILLGITQGITEWLPVSSSGMLLLIKANFFSDSTLPLTENLQFISFLHLGTFFSALIYFRKDVRNILRTLFTFKKSSLEERALVVFLFISTSISALISYALIDFIRDAEQGIEFTGPVANLVIGALLLVTALLVMGSNRNSEKVRPIKELSLWDGIFLGLMQGVSALPGISRSGTTIAGLLLRKVEKTSALKISFLMSLPIILGANIALNSMSIVFSTEYVVGFIASFVSGIITIHLLLKISQKINLGYFILLLAIFLIVASLIPN